MAKVSFFYRFLLWREQHIKEKHFILLISFFGRYLHGGSGDHSETAHPFYPTPADGQFQHGGSELSLPALSGSGYLVGRPIREIHRAR